MLIIKNIKNNTMYNMQELHLSLGQTKLCQHNPPRSTTIHHHPPPRTTSQNISTTIHHHPPPPTTSQNISTTTRHHPPQPKIYLPPFTTTHWQLFNNKSIYKNLKPLSDGNVRNLNSTPEIAKFFTWPSIIFTTYTRNGFKKLQCERTFILCETSLVLKKDK